MDNRIGVVGPRQAHRALDLLEKLQVDAGFLADLAGGHVHAVIADDATGGHQYRCDFSPNLFDGEALAQ